MPKKLKTVVKSLYSHEIRKDVSLAELRSLKLEDAWPFIREEIETEIGSSQLVCIPHVTEAALYTVTSLFLQEGEGSALRPLGALSALADRARTAPALLPDSASLTDTTFKFPHDSVKITLQDEKIKNKVRVIMVNFTRTAAPPALLEDPLQDLYLDTDKGIHRPLPRHGNTDKVRGSGEVYMVASALRVGTLEFRVTRGTSSRIFHLGTSTPLLLSLQRYRLDPDGRLINKGPVSKIAKHLRWQRIGPPDCLYTSDESTQ